MLAAGEKKVLLPLPPPPPPLPFTSFFLYATISDCFNNFPFCLPETIFNCTAEVWLFTCFDTSTGS